MNTQPGDDEFGFKRLSQGNWLAVDPIWRAFGMDVERIDPTDPWIADVLSYSLGPKVPIEIRKVFEVARGAIAYGLLYYPLLTVGTEQLFRVYEIAATIKCEQLGAPIAETKQFIRKIDWLRKQGVISAGDHVRWDSARQLRNHASHPKMQSIVGPNMALDMLEGTSAMINSLFP